MALVPDDLCVETPRGQLFTRTWGITGDRRGLSVIILLHESLGSVELWRDFPEALFAATGHPVVAYDRLGFGRSDPYPGRLDCGFIREEGCVSLPALREHFDIGSMILFGHSVGGALAVAAAAILPECTSAVITESTISLANEETRAGLLAVAPLFRTADQLERLAKYHGDKAQWVLDAWLETWLGPDFVEWRLDDELRQLRCPVLALHGDRDEYGSLQQALHIADLAPAGGQVAIVENCGHVPHKERPVDVIRHVAGFLAGIS